MRRRTAAGGRCRDGGDGVALATGGQFDRCGGTRVRAGAEAQRRRRAGLGGAVAAAPASAVAPMRCSRCLRGWPRREQSWGPPRQAAAMRAGAVIATVRARGERLPAQRRLAHGAALHRRRAARIRHRAAATARRTHGQASGQPPRPSRVVRVRNAGGQRRQFGVQVRRLAAAAFGFGFAQGIEDQRHRFIPRHRRWTRAGAGRRVGRGQRHQRRRARPAPSLASPRRAGSGAPLPASRHRRWPPPACARQVARLQAIADPVGGRALAAQAWGLARKAGARHSAACSPSQNCCNAIRSTRRRSSPRRSRT